MTISVVIPAYNAGRFIEDAITSVLRQETPAAEIIVVNDGSTDRGYRDLERLHDTIRVIDQPNRGVSAARNLGCDVATGRYIAILDADDVWLPGKLGAQLAHLRRHPEVDAVFCRGLLWLYPQSEPPRLVPEDPPGPPGSCPATALCYSDLLCSPAVAPSTLLIKRSVWRELRGFDERLRYGEDHDFYLRLSHGHKVDVLETIGMLYRRHPGSATATIQNDNHLADVLTATLRSLGTTDKFGQAVDRVRLSQRLARIHLEHGYAHFLSGSFRIARREYALAARMRPLDVRAMGYLAVAHVPWLRGMVRRLRQSVIFHETGQLI